jgi:hypothetical protein
VAEANERTICVVSRWREQLGEYGAVLLLTALGLIWSLSFWQYSVFPAPDYFSFVTTGRQWLSFEIPTSMMRAPAFSIIAGLGSMIFSDPRAQLAATELYNALLLPTSMILFYLVGRGLLGRPAALVTALLAGISPRMIEMSSRPLAEMTLVALFAAAVLCVARGRVGWAYIFAMLASITRWDMAGLIPAVALVDLAHRRRLRSVLGRAILASVPFLLCMLLTAMRLAGPKKGGHYLQILAEERTLAFWQDLDNYRWVMTAWINAPPSWKTAGGSRVIHTAEPALFWMTTLLLSLTVLWGSWQGWRQRRWEILVILVTGVPYVVIHAVYPYRLERFCVPVAWAGLIIAVYGARQIVAFPQNPWPAWRWVGSILLVGAAPLFVVWALGVALTLNAGIELKKVSPMLGATVCWSEITAIAGYLGYEWVRGARRGLHWLAVPAFLALAIVSSGTLTGKVMGDGKHLMSFKTLSLWFKDHARPGDKLVTTMPDYMPIYTGLPLDSFVQTGSISRETAPDFPSFIQACRQRGATLLAWDSRLEGSHSPSYGRWGLDRIAPLAAPFTDEPAERIGSCQLMQVVSEEWPLIAVWRILPEN